MNQSLGFAIVIALKEEFTEFWRSCESKYEVELDSETDCIYYKFELPGLTSKRQCVALMIGEMGPTRAAVAVGRLIEQYHPRVVVNIGIAASLDEDIRLGDVVAATSVDAYLE